MLLETHPQTFFPTPPVRIVTRERGLIKLSRQPDRVV